MSENKAALAIIEFKAAITLSPNFGLAYRSLATANMMISNNAAAAVAYRRFIELEPKHPDVPKVQEFLEDYDKKNP